MPPRLVVCSCDPRWRAFAVCPICEHRQLEAVLEKRGLVAREHPSSDAWDALVVSYFGDDNRVNDLDLADRARDAADAWRMGRGA